MLSKIFWLDALERAIKSMAQFGIAIFGAAQFNLLSADWKIILGSMATGFILSVLTSIASLPIGPANSASLIGKNNKE